MTEVDPAALNYLEQFAGRASAFDRLADQEAPELPPEWRDEVIDDPRVRELVYRSLQRYEAARRLLGLPCDGPHTPGQVTTGKKLADGAFALAEEDAGQAMAILEWCRHMLAAQMLIDEGLTFRQLCDRLDEDIGCIPRVAARRLGLERPPERRSTEDYKVKAFRGPWCLFDPIDGEVDGDVLASAMLEDQSRSASTWLDIIRQAQIALVIGALENRARMIEVQWTIENLRRSWPGSFGLSLDQMIASENLRRDHEGRPPFKLAERDDIDVRMAVDP